MRSRKTDSVSAARRLLSIASLALSTNVAAQSPWPVAPVVVQGPAQDRERVFRADNNVVPTVLEAMLPNVHAVGVDWSRLLKRIAVIGVYLEPGPDLCEPGKDGYRTLEFYALEAGPDSRLTVNVARSSAVLELVGPFSRFRPAPSFCDDGTLIGGEQGDGRLHMEFSISGHLTPRNFQTGLAAATRNLQAQQAAACGNPLTAATPACTGLAPVLAGLPNSSGSHSGYFSANGVQVPLLELQPGIASAPREMMGGVGGFGMPGGAANPGQLLQQFGIDLGSIMASVPQNAQQMVQDALNYEPSFTGTLADRSDIYVAKVPFTYLHFNISPKGIAELEMFQPAVFGGGRVSDAREASVGAQTMVNLDNDDGDVNFDDSPANPVPSGDDNELIKLVLRVDSGSPEPGVARLEVAGGEHIRIWRAADRSAEFDPAQPVSVPAGGLVETLWVEGIEPHTAPRGTTLRLSYDGQAGMGDEVALTVVGVQALHWQGQKNGYQPDSHDSDQLDADPNFKDAASSVEGQRVFPGARSGGFKQARDRVGLRIELTVPPVMPLTLYARSFDVDDPDDDLAWIDPNDQGCPGRPCLYPGTSIEYTAESDNRGHPRAGRLDGELGRGVAPVTFNASEASKTIDFRVSLHPGDNYRVVVNADRGFLEQLRNQDAEDGMRIVDPRVRGAAAEQEIRRPARYASKVLSVWRLLHIERDSMTAVPATGPERNFREGYVVAAEGTSSTGAQKLRLNVDLTATRIPDLSPNLDGGGRGRFENGSIELGSARVQTDGLLGNGPDYVNAKASFKLPFVLTAASGAGLPVLTGQVFAFGQGGFALRVDDPGRLRHGYAGGSLQVAGEVMPVTGVDPRVHRVRVSGSGALAFVLRDDDRLARADGTPLLPYLPDLSDMQVYRDAYLEPLDDGGGNAANNQQDLPFKLNVDNTDAAHLAVYDAYRQSKAVENPAFWVVYLCSAYQEDTYYAPAPHAAGEAPGCGPALANQCYGDEDPDAPETGVGGYTSPSWVGPNDTPTSADHRLATGGEGSLVFRETERELELKDAEKTHSKAVAHEVGHQFGLGHAQGGLMDGRLHGGSELKPESVHFIRSRDSSPGQ